MRYDKTVALRIKMASYSLLNIQDTCNKIKSLSVSTDKEVLIKGPYPLPNKKRRWCLLKSPHVYKKSREHNTCLWFFCCTVFACFFVRGRE